MVVRDDQGEQTSQYSSFIYLYLLFFVINSLGIIHVDDGNLCETRNYLEMRQISTKINNTPAITG